MQYLCLECAGVGMKYDGSADGLRGLASLNVTLAHFVAAFWPELLRFNYPGLEFQQDPLTPLEEVLSSPLVTLLFNGHFAVLVFFVLSGYVLAMPARNGNFTSIRGRLWGRYLRLNIPIAAACMTSWALLQVGAYWNQDAALLTGSQWLALYFKADISFLQMVYISSFGGIFGDGSLVPPLWSLRVEFIGSVVLLAWLAIFRSWYVMAALAVMSFSLGLAGQVFIACIILGGLLNWISLPKFAGYMVGGIGVYLGAYQPQSVWFVWLPAMGDDPKTLYNAIGASLLVASVCRSCAFHNPFSTGPLKSLGEISYAMYLIHFPLLCSVASYVVVKLGSGAAGLAVSLAVYVSLTFFLSALMTTVVDRPAQALSKSFAQWVEASFRSATQSFRN